MPFMVHHPSPGALSQDLGHWVWVMEDIRKSLNHANSVVYRFEWDAKNGTHATSRSQADLQTALRQIEQSAGVLEMVGQQQTAKIVRAMGKWMQILSTSAEMGIEDGNSAFENACRALLDYFDGLLKGGFASPVALFLQYKAIAELAGTDRIHPADLWLGVGSWESYSLASPVSVTSSDVIERSQLDESLLPVLQYFDAANARRMVDLCSELACTNIAGAAQTFWWIAAAFFDALSRDELPRDVYVRRTAARLIPAYGLLATGQIAALSGLVHEMLFYCAYAPSAVDGSELATALGKVKKAFGLERTTPLHYESSHFGRFDHAQLANLRKLIAIAAEGWSAFSGGDVGRAPTVVAQFGEMGAAVLQLNPQSDSLVSALSAAVEASVPLGKPPMPAIAIEVATAILYLEVAYDDLDLASRTLEQRSVRLAVRLQHVLSGGDPLPIERWMEALYRRVGDRKMMGTVVDELAHWLLEIESAVDLFVRDPSHCVTLESVPVALGHMRGVFSVLGLSQAALASLRMRSMVESLLAPEGVALETAKKWTLQLVNSLSAMGFLVGMLRYQPAMAKELFEYDENSSEFRLTMKREQSWELAERGSQVQALSLDDELPIVPRPAEGGGTSATSAAHPLTLEKQEATQDDPVDVEIQDIFLNEARDVIEEGRASVIALGLASSNLSGLGSLRRAFHTLKGSARMVGLVDFGEAAWAFEQLLNAWLERNRPASDVLLALCDEALGAMTVWVDAISENETPRFQAADFRRCADALRLEDRRLSLRPDDAPTRAESAPSSHEAQEVASTAPLDADSPPEMDSASIYEGISQGVHSTSSPGVNIVAVGSLELRLDFFEVFVNEARPWAAQLQSEVLSWPVPAFEDAVQRAAGLAHALHGSAAAVGFVGLAASAQLLERVFEHVDLHEWTVTGQKALLCEAVQDVNRLINAFAGGSLLQPNASTLDALVRLLEAGVFSSAEMESGAGRSIADTGLERLAVGQEPYPQYAETPLVQVIQDPTNAALSALSKDDFETLDVLNADLWPVFFEEGVDLVKGLSKSVHLWASQPRDAQLRTQALRILHTLKGSARLAGAMRLGELAHRMESAAESVTVDSLSKKPEMAPLLSYLEQLEAMFVELASRIDADTLEQQAKLQIVTQPGFDRPVESVSTLLPLTPARIATGASIRVRAQVIDRLIDQAGEVMTSRTKMDQRLGQLHGSLNELGRSLHRLGGQLRDLELQTELQMRSRQSQSLEVSPLFDPLELDRFTALQEVSRMMAESVADVGALHKGLQNEVEGAQEDLLGQGRRAKELTHGLLRMRLVEFESISDRLYGVVRQVAKETGKLVRLDIEGGSIEMDRGVLDRMTPSFEHMLRNAVVHGIEPSDLRATAGKPATGAICISVQQDGSDVSVRFSDDGAGLQMEKIRARAVEAGLLGADQPLNYAQAAKLLFVPGFSTAENVTELAGRGIGMDVVLSDVSAIGGRIETSAHADGGTIFELVFPLTTAVTQIVLLRMDTVTIGVPANLLETVLRIPQDQLKEAYTKGVLPQAHGDGIPFFWAGAIVGVSTRGYRESVGARQQSVAVIRSAGQRVGLHVDEVLGNREVVVKNLGTQLSQLPGLVGITVLASGAVVLIYNPVALMNVYGESIRQVEGVAHSAHAGSSGMDVVPVGDGALARSAPLVLVVDDSITVRRVTQRLLSRAGLRVALASDGVQALELLRDERPVLVLSDIEMPRMDGMELTRQIRADAKLTDLPIIIITSRTAQKHRDHAAALGANHYLGKPYAEAELLDLIRFHCAMTEFA